MHEDLRDKTPPLARQVYDGLLGDIAESRRKAGERLVEAAIARERDVSRTPVREALSRLENDGLIQGTSPSGYVVICPSIEDIREIFEIRRALEPVAFAGVTRRAHPGDDARLVELRDRVQAADTALAAARANSGFRDFWLHRIPNLRLRDTLMRYHLQVQVVRAATLVSVEGRAAAQAGTRALTASFLDRDPVAAHAAMAAFVDTALAFFEQADAEGVLQPARKPDRKPGPDGQ